MLINQLHISFKASINVNIFTHSLFEMSPEKSLFQLKNKYVIILYIPISQACTSQKKVLNKKGMNILKIQEITQLLNRI